MRRLLLILVALLLISCTRMEGLKVLTGQPVSAQGADPIADQIEADTDYLDVVETVTEDGRLEVYALFAFPEVQDEAQALAVLKEIHEAVWKHVTLETGSVVVYLLQAQPVYTLEHGISRIAIFFQASVISVEDMRTYLAGTRTAEDYLALVQGGVLLTSQPEKPTLYTRTPNHPLR